MSHSVSRLTHQNLNFIDVHLGVFSRVSLIPGWKGMRACEYMPFVCPSVLNRYAASEQNLHGGFLVRFALSLIRTGRRAAYNDRMEIVGLGDRKLRGRDIPVCLALQELRQRGASA
jgi:hypothetical protein